MILKAAASLATLCVLFISLQIAVAEEGVNRVRVIPVPNHGEPAAAKADANGTMHLLYHSPDGPQYVKSTDNGNTFSAPIPVVDPASRKPGLEFQIWDMAVGKGGRLHVAMSTNAWKLKLPENEWAYYYASLAPEAQAFSPVRNLNGKPSEGFSIAADDQGNVTACWLSDKLYANVSRDNGKTFANAVEINTQYDPCNCCTTSTVYDADGKLAVMYREETNNERDMYLVLWDQNRGTTTRTRISETLWKVDLCPMNYYNVSLDPKGLVAVWPTRLQIYFARLDKQGNLIPPGEIKTPGKSAVRSSMLALSASDESTLVAWTKENQLGWQLYDANGRPIGDPGSAQSSGHGVAGVVNQDGNFILFRWREGN